MKSFFNAFIAICSLIAATLLIGCSDDLHLRNEVGSELTENSEYRISSFKVSHDLWTIPKDCKSIDVMLESKSAGTLYQLAATVEHGSTEYAISLMIPKDKHLADGDYIITGALTDGTPLGSIIEATVQNEMLHKVLSVTSQYKLSGGGTQANPYLIGSYADFNNLLASLANDDTHALGLHFRQTADFTTTASSSVLNGNPYTGYDFAGIYDGQSHTITLNYMGKSSQGDNAVGLFPALRDSANISNLNIKAMISGVKSNAGAFAGICTGKVLLNNVNVVGSIMGQESIGAFIGNCQGNLTVSNCTAHMLLSGAKYVGGIAGSATAGSLTVSTFTSQFDKDAPNFLSAEATVSHVGGVVGYVNNCAINFNKVTIKHTINSQTTNVEVLKTPNYCGGLIGEAIINQASSITDCTVVTPLICPLSYAGGLIGKVQLNADLKISSANIGVYINTSQYVGGFFGHVIADDHLTIDGNGDNGTNMLAKIDGSHCGIAGAQYVGGLFGYFKGNVEPKDVFINMNVNGSTSHVGGLVGMIEDSSVKCGSITFGANMVVKGPESVGGIVGYANASTIEGSVGSKTLTTSMAASTYPSLCPIIVSCDSVNSQPVRSTDIGGIVGYGENSTIQNVSFSGSVTGHKYVGGVVGRLVLQSQGCLKNCANNGLVVRNAWDDYTGGVVGYVEYTTGTIENLVNFANIAGQNSTGGIIGAIKLTDQYNESVFILSSLNRGTVSGTVNVGGCIGYLSGNIAHYVPFSIAKFGNTGNVSSTNNGNVGGIIGHGNKNYLRVRHCANHGKISSTGNAKVGGIAGRLGTNTKSIFGVYDNMELSYCCNRGEISSTHKGSNVGGILGYQEDGSSTDDTYYMTHDCYNAGIISSQQGSDNGGVVGYVDNMAEVVRCFSFGNVTKGNGVVGTCKKVRDWYHHNLFYLEGTGKGWCCKSFKYENRGKQSTFTGFNFNNNWIIDPNKNDGYPYLKICPFQFM